MRNFIVEYSIHYLYYPEGYPFDPDPAISHSKRRPTSGHASLIFGFVTDNG